MEHEVDVAVVGAGVVGLAVARELALAGREVVVFEAEAGIGMHASSRNSEVIHAGIYYPTASRKARHCVEGRRLLYRYCEEHDVPHARIGKIIVAVRDEEIAGLERLRGQAERNGVLDLEWLDAAAIRELEPEVRGVRGLLSPSSGIIDSHALMTAFRADARSAGAEILVSSPIRSGSVTNQGILLDVGGDEPSRVSCGSVVNSAGLFASDVARSIRGLPESAIFAPYYAKGHYFTLAGRSPFRRLVYPMPTPGGLGVHVTLDLSGQVRFGPDVSWLDSIDYSFDERRGEAFYAAIRAYFPNLADGALLPGYTGIRAKLGPAGAPAQDFVVQGPAEHGVPGLVQLFGIESPGLTASLALAREVKALLFA